MKVKVRVNYKRLLIILAVVVLIAVAAITTVTLVTNNKNKKKVENYGFDVFYIDEKEKYVTYSEARRIILAAILNTTNLEYYSLCGIFAEYDLAGWIELSDMLGVESLSSFGSDIATEELAAQYAVSAIETVLEIELKGDTAIKKARRIGLGTSGKKLKKSELNKWIIQVFEDYGVKAITGGAEIRYTNKPINASIYPFIVKEIDKKIYTLNMDNIDELPKDLYLKYHDSFINIKEVVEQYFNLILNVDYTNIDQELFIDMAEESFAYGIDEEVVQAYFMNVSDNKIKVEGKATAQIPIFYGNNGKYYIRVKCEFNILESNSNSNILFNDQNHQYDEKKYEIYVDVPVVCISSDGVFKLGGNLNIWSNIVYER